MIHTFLEEYPLGKKISIAYKPNSPGVACLKPGKGGDGLLFFIGLFTLGIIGIIIFMVIRTIS